MAVPRWGTPSKAQKISARGSRPKHSATILSDMNPAPVISHDKLLDLLLDVVCVVNKEGRFLSVSAASERVFGYTPQELIGRTALN
ncbi:PAS domain S-box protein [Halopseudomonas pachastrellae]|nr:PAS domain S-box protein [Halopseudomonas pachastrellae]